MKSHGNRVPNRLLTDTLREIKNTRSRFISILILSALAVCFLAGLRVTEPDMKNSVDQYLDQQKLMDLRVVSTLGLTQEDVEVLSQQEGVTLAQGAYTIDATVRLEDMDSTVKVLSYTDDLNLPDLVEGRMPENQGECLVEPRFLLESGLSLGDTITLDTGTGDYEDALVQEEFTIVGTANSPLYIGVERGSSTLGTGKVNYFLLLPMESFQMDSYTDAYLLLEGASELMTYSDRYEDLIQEYVDALEPLADERAALRSESFREEIADGEKEIEEARQELEDARQELADARQELDEGWADYNQGKADYNTGVQEYQDGLTEYQDGVTETQDAQKKLEDGWAQYQDGLDEYTQGVYDLDNAAAQLQSQQDAFMAGLEQFRGQLAKLGLSYPDTDSLLAALADPTQSAAIDGALDQARANLESGIQLLEGISALESQLGDLANLSLSDFQTEISRLEGNVQALQQSIKDLEEFLADMDESDPNYPAFEAQLEELQAHLDFAQTSLAAYVSALPYREQLEDLRTQRDAAGLTGSTPADLLNQLNQLEGLSASYFLSAYQAILGGWDQIAAGKAELAKAKKKLDAAYEELEDGQAQLRAGEWELADAKQELEDAETELKDGWAELEDGRQELVDGEAEYADGYEEFQTQEADAEQEIADAQKKLEQAQRDLEEKGECEWYLLDRNTNTGFVSYSMDADRMGNLASVFPLIFFLVAALVCLTTMTRMVEEQRVAIGGMKALGYSKGAIAIKYVGYGFLASAAGSVIGLAIGLALLPWIICTAWKIIYTFGPIHYGIEPLTSITACLAAVGTVTLSALGACFNTLTAVPAQLMRPKAPPMGKRILLERITPLWQRLSFNYKITLRNLFRYQKRFWMTVVGIGGCAALIVTAFGLRDSIFAVMDKQFDDIYLYAAQAGLVDRITPGEWSEIESALEESSLVTDWSREHTETVTAESSAYTADATLEVAEDSSVLERFVNLRHRTDDEPVTLPDDGVILTEKLSLLLGVEPGDTITLDGDSRVEVKVADVTEHYIQHSIYISRAYYEEVFGQEPEENTLLIAYNVEDPQAADLEQELVALDGINSLTRMVDTRKTFGTSLESVDYAVALIIVCAAALAFVVLYNLTNINITERMRELATLKVLGFYDGELSAYIYRENVILTVFGVALGMVLGKLLHQWLILTVEIDLLMFGRQVELSSYLWAILLTTIFSLVVNLAAHRKLKKLDMVESLKTVE